MAPHSSTLSWKIPWTEEPGRLQSMGSLGVAACAPPRHAHGDLTSLEPHERLPEILVGLSVVSDSSRPHGLQPTRLLHPWDFPGKSTGVGCHYSLNCLLLSKGVACVPNCSRC